MRKDKTIKGSFSLIVLAFLIFSTGCDRNFNNIVDILNPDRDTTAPNAPELEYPINGSSAVYDLQTMGSGLDI